jgi:hypothetical protein
MIGREKLAKKGNGMGWGGTGEYMKSELKTILDMTCELFNEIDKKTQIMEKANAKGELCNILKFELLSFLCCLSACDGRISRVEAAVIREYLGIEMYPINIKEFNQQNHIGNDEFYKKIPECLKIAVATDNHMMKHGLTCRMGVSDTVLELFKVFGKEMIISDNKVKAEEQIVWGKYITMMTRYLAEKCDIYRESDKEQMNRPATPIEVRYDMSLDKVGRIYTVYIGTLR